MHFNSNQQACSHAQMATDNKVTPRWDPRKRGFPIGQSNRDTVNGKLTARRRHFDPSWDINGRTLFSRHFYPSGSLLLLALNRWRPAAQKETDPSPSRHRDDPDYFAGPSFFSRSLGK